MDQFEHYVIGNYRRFPAVIDRGEGSTVWDIDGNSYLDLFPGWGCNLIGHCPPRVVEAVRDQVGRLIHVPNTWYIAAQGELGEALATRSFTGAKCFFCNSGTEANEALIKLARIHGHASGRTKILATHGSFHGRTYASLSATGQPKYHNGFEPLVPGFVHVPFDDLDAMSEAADEETAAILVEPIQGEGGVRIPSPGYLEGLREICDRAGALLLLDEVQTGMGRTGKWFAWQHSAIEPDGFSLAKALAGGIAMGAIVAREEVADHLKPGTHAATFGGNPIAARASLAMIETIEEGNLLERAYTIGARFHWHFQAFRNERPDLLKSIRIAGAMIGLELAIDATGIVDACLQRRLLINATQGNVIRLLPALTITDDAIERGCSILIDVLREAAVPSAV
jgi:predicted acetylornithine/succinylornithine family transaminase